MGPRLLSFQHLSTLPTLGRQWVRSPIPGGGFEEAQRHQGDLCWTRGPGWGWPGFWGQCSRAAPLPPPPPPPTHISEWERPQPPSSPGVSKLLEKARQ